MGCWLCWLVVMCVCLLCVELCSAQLRLGWMVWYVREFRCWHTYYNIQGTQRTHSYGEHRTAEHRVSFDSTPSLSTLCIVCWLVGVFVRTCSCIKHASARCVGVCVYVINVDMACQRCVLWRVSCLLSSAATARRRRRCRRRRHRTHNYY